MCCQNTKLILLKYNIVFHRGRKITQNMRDSKIKIKMC